MEENKNATWEILEPFIYVRTWDANVFTRNSSVPDLVHCCASRPPDYSTQFLENDNFFDQ